VGLACNARQPALAPQRRDGAGLVAGGRAEAGAVHRVYEKGGQHVASCDGDRRPGEFRWVADSWMRRRCRPPPPLPAGRAGCCCQAASVCQILGAVQAGAPTPHP